MIMQKTLILLFILIYSISFSQIDKKLLQGEWIVYKREMKDGSRYFSGTPIENPYTIFAFNNDSFYSKNYITDKNSPFNIKIKIKGNNIIISETRYKTVEKLTDSELVFVDIDTQKEENNLIRYYLKKFNLESQKDLDKRRSKDTLVTSFALSPFPQERILKDVLFNNRPDLFFRVKGYLLFDMDKKIIKTFFYNSKDISSEEKNIISNSFASSFELWNFKLVKNFKFIKMPFLLVRYKYLVYENFYTHISEAYNTENFEDVITSSNLQDIEESEKSYILGLKCYNGKKYDCAISNFKKSYEKNKYNLDAHYNYASINFALGRKEEACKKWNELIKYGQKEAEKEYQQNKCKK